MTPRWGSELQEGRHISIKMPPLRGSIRVRRYRPASTKLSPHRPRSQPNRLAYGELDFI